MITTDEEAQIKISRARISLQRTQPFWAYLSLFLKPIEAKIPTMAVDIKGSLYYNPTFINKLNDDEMVGLIAHELGHIIFLSHLRGEKLNHQIFNIATDTAINQILKDNKFILPDGAIWSNDNNEIVIFDKIIKNIPSKQAEDIYYEIYGKVKSKIKSILKKGKVKKNSTGNDGGVEFDINDLEGYEIEGSSNDNSGKIRNIDNHIKNNSEVLSKEEKQKYEKEWIERTIEASQISRIAGKEPIGISRIIKGLHESKINWKNLLQRYIQNYIPNDFTYSKPNKKSVSCGYYMPNVEKQRIEIYCCVDLSGSIGQEEMNDFLSEIVGIARAYREKVRFHLWTHQTEVDNKYILENGSVQKILNLKMIGNGGTSHKDCFSQLAKERECKVCLFFTDGFSDISKEDKPKYPVIWIITKNGIEDKAFPFGKIIRLK